MISFAEPPDYAAAAAASCAPSLPQCLPGSTGSNKSSLTGPPAAKPGCALDTARHVGDLGCEERLGDALPLDEHEEEQQQQGRPTAQHNLSFTFGSLSPMGSPARPPGFYSPGPPYSPAQAKLPVSPARPSGLASPRSVRITGSVRLVGDNIIPLPPSIFGLAAAMPAAWQLPFAGAPETGLEGLERVIAREPSFHDLLLQQAQQVQRTQPVQSPLGTLRLDADGQQQQGQELQKPQLQPPQAKPATTRPPPAPRATQLPSAAAAPAAAPAIPPEVAPLLSPRKRARKSPAKRAACDDMEATCSGPGQTGQEAARCVSSD